MQIYCYIIDIKFPKNNTCLYDKGIIINFKLFVIVTSFIRNVFCSTEFNT
jgi:hypothetical protein